MIKRLYRTFEQAACLPMRLTSGAIGGVFNAFGEVVEDLVFLWSAAAPKVTIEPDPDGYWQSDYDKAAALIADAETQPVTLDLCLHCGLEVCEADCPGPAVSGLPWQNVGTLDLMDGKTFLKREIECGHVYETSYSGSEGVWVTRDGLPHMSIGISKANGQEATS